MRANSSQDGLTLEMWIGLDDLATSWCTISHSLRQTTVSCNSMYISVTITKRSPGKPKGAVENREDKEFRVCHFPLGCFELACIMRLYYLCYRLRYIDSPKVIRSRLVLSSRICYAYCWDVSYQDQRWNSAKYVRKEYFSNAHNDLVLNTCINNSYHNTIATRSRVQKFPAWPTFEGDRNKTTLLFFNVVSLHFDTLFNWYINLTIDDTIYPSPHFPFSVAFVCQAGNFWTLLRIKLIILIVTDMYHKFN